MLYARVVGMQVSSLSSSVRLSGRRRLVCADQQINTGTAKPGIRAESFDHPSAFLDPHLIAQVYLMSSQIAIHLTSQWRPHEHSNKH
jgi:hypothetical protein